MKKLIKESGIRDINKLRREFDKVIIVTHQDSDGVFSGIGMKKYFENYGFKVVDVQIIQYGDKEWSLKKSDPNDKILYCLCDFAHGKPMFTIHLDHHDTQAGVEQGTATNFKSSRSNVETISQSVSPKDIFSPEDITLISTVDSADYAKYDITPEEVMNYLFKLDKDKSLQRNKMLMGLVVNKLLLAYKNKPGFLESLVMNSNPSLLSVLNNIKAEMIDKGYANIESLEKNKEDYVRSMKRSSDVKVEDGIIVQYGGGYMMKPGSYDRYTPFRNNPDADFIVIAWPLGLVQASCNPFKKERALKGVNLGEIKDEVLSKWESQLKTREIPLSTIKWVSESGKAFGPESVGFTYKDFDALYGNKLEGDTGNDLKGDIRVAMEKPFTSLTEDEQRLLDSITVSAWDIIMANSGGHKCITNISGLSYLGRSTRPPQGKSKYGAKSDDSPYIKFTKMIQDEFVKVLKEKIGEDGGDRYEPDFEVEIAEQLDLKKKETINESVNPKFKSVLKWLNKEFGDLTPVVEDDKTYYVDEDRKPLFFYYQNEKNGSVYINYDRIWVFFESIFGLKRPQTLEILKVWLEETYNLRGLTPFVFESNKTLPVGRDL